MSTVDMAKRRDAELTREVGARIRALRQEQGVTQEALAERLKLQPGTLSRVENGVVGASLATLSEISRALGVPMSALVDAAPPGSASELSAEELALLRFFRDVPAECRPPLTELVRAAAGLRGGGRGG